MKYKLTTARIVVLIAMVNLVVAVSSLTIQPFSGINPCEYLPTVVFCLVTFPVLTFVGNPILTSTSMWAIPLLYVLLVLNGVLWGIAGVYGAGVCGRLYRLFWIEPDGVVVSNEADLKWDVLFVVFTHFVLLVILIGLLISLIPISLAVMGDFCGTLPLPARLLIGSSFVMQKHPLVSLLLLGGSLYLDGRNYIWLCRTRGKKAATIWASSVSMVILLAIVWYTSLALIFLNTVIHWRIR